MSRVTTLQRAAGALCSIDDPFRVMTSLLLLVALASERHSNVGMPAGAYWGLGPEPTGEQLNALLGDLEAGCPHQLEGALATDSLATARPDALRGAFKHICRFLTDRHEHERDIFGAAFMEGQSMSAQQRLGAFHSPGCLTAMIAKMAGAGGPVAPASWLIEPSCGTGAMLLSWIDEAIAAHGPLIAQSITYIGVELNPASARLARMNMVLAGAADQAEIFCGDALTRDIVALDTATGRTRRVMFDDCIGNPPFGGSGVNVRALVAGEPFVISDRLLDRPVAVPEGFTPRERCVPATAPPPGPPDPRPGEQLGFDIPDAA
jgi:hypothetical protein